MSAQERLAAALHPSGFIRITDTDTGEDIVRFPTADMARSVLTADPHLAQDIEDGRALRELREALPERSEVGASYSPEASVWTAWSLGPFDSFHRYQSAPTIAEAADACRAALTEGKP